MLTALAQQTLRTQGKRQRCHTPVNTLKVGHYMLSYVTVDKGHYTDH